MLSVSIFTGIYYWIMKTDIGLALTHAMRQPLFAALFIGIIMGDLTQALIIGAAVQIPYIGLVAAGSNLPADDCLAGLIAIPISLSAGLSPEVAVAIAVPVGVLGVFVDQLRKTINVAFVHMADRFAEKGNTRQITLINILYSSLSSFFLRFPIPFFANLYGANAVDNFMQAIPNWLTHGFTIAGGLLPALGFALTMFVIGKKELLPWFFIGYFLVEFSNIPIIGVAIFGLCAILLINIYKSTEVEG
ncbi:PTS sorbose transporter subunit IIC [Tetragenococcus halophilus subsp. flandriensis]|uniref:PTS mannose/fructose/sorbose/N-acetylgalactosamine transporter subunit IIC n=1 Tax=Tetragenococcus halophilus TaxID=51669 RepID=UPI0023E92C33|nr:PTS sugar transporter subunit IIC [Tetragenococcus halophilus]GMA08814.1 PTS sorbose transporter subunit IIC [Tetragenococcus halophilus subsp. flandriensis]